MYSACFSLESDDESRLSLGLEFDKISFDFLRNIKIVIPMIRRTAATEPQTTPIKASKVKISLFFGVSPRLIMTKKSE